MGRTLPALQRYVLVYVAEFAPELWNWSAPRRFDVRDQDPRVY